MASLTPHSRNAEATYAATVEGAINGLLTLVPSAGTVYLLLQNSAGFARRTNWQSRTALAIMPPLFVFAWTAEHKLLHKMRDIAQETQHSTATVEWAEREVEKQRQLQQQQQQHSAAAAADHHFHLTELYQQSIRQSGVRIVPGDELPFRYRVANFVAENPIKVLASLAVPSVAWIFYGRTGKQHLDFSVKLLHTRVFGQFATISLLLSVMGFKEFMDSNGKYISQAEADARVEEMQWIRAQLMERLAKEKQHQQEMKRELELAHEQVVKERSEKKSTAPPSASIAAAKGTSAPVHAT